MKSNLFQKLMFSSFVIVLYFTCVSQAIAVHSNGNHTAANTTSADLKSSATNDQWLNAKLDKIEKSVLHDDWRSEEERRKSDRNHGDPGMTHWYNHQLIHELKRDPNKGRQHWGTQRPQHWRQWTPTSRQNKYNYDRWSNSGPKYGPKTGLQQWQNSILDDDCDGWNIRMYRDGGDRWSSDPWNPRTTQRSNSQRSDEWGPSNKPRCDDWRNTYTDDSDSHWGWNSGKQNNNNYRNSRCRSGEKNVDGWTRDQDSTKWYNDRGSGKHWGSDYDKQNNGWSQNRIDHWGQNDDDDHSKGWSDDCKGDYKCQREQMNDRWSKPSGWASEQREPQDWLTVVNNKRFLGGITQKGSSASQHTEHNDFSKTKWLGAELTSAFKKPHWN